MPNWHCQYTGSLSQLIMDIFMKCQAYEINCQVPTFNDACSGAQHHQELSNIRGFVAQPDTNSISSASGMWKAYKRSSTLIKPVLDLNALIQTLVGRHEESGKFCCLTCGKLFEAKQSVERHAEIHLGLSHHCIVCDKVFNTRNTLATHYTKQHPNEVATPWAMKLK